MSKKLPSITSDIPRDLRTFIDRLRELVSGGGADRLLSPRDLATAGLANVDSGGNISVPQPYLATPPAPTGVVAAGAVRNIIVEWGPPQYAGHAYAEVWRSETSTLGSAVMIGLSPGALYTDPVGSGVTRYYWVRFVNTLDVAGPYNSVSGTSATTGPEVTYLLSSLAGSITTSELAAALNSRINLIDGPSTTLGTIPNQLAVLQGQIDVLSNYPDYDNGTTYAADDIVKYEGAIYKATQATTGNLPTNTTYWLKIGDYSSLADVVAAHTAELVILNDGLDGEVTARETLAAQLRGSYTGTDLSSVTAGLIFSERTARATADLGLASDISVVGATAANKSRIFRANTAPSSPAVNDIWVDISNSYSPSYSADDYSTLRNKQYQWNGSTWIDITDTDISDNYAQIIKEQTARATADLAIAQDVTTLNAYVLVENTAIRADLQTEATTRASADGALSSLITTLDAQVNNATTGLPATRATLLNDYSTTATVNSAIATSKTVLRAYADVGSKVFRQTSAPTKRGVDADTALDIPLGFGDTWIDTDDQNKLYQWTGSEWVYSPDGVITGSVASLNATLTTDYLTAADTNSAIASSGTFLRAYADNTSKVFRQNDAPTKRGVDSETAADIPLGVGDAWVDTNDQNKFYLWTGSEWVYSPDAAITGAIDIVDARVTTVETTKIGYATRNADSATFDNDGAIKDKAGVDAWNVANPDNQLTWNVGLPLAEAVKQVSVTDAEGNTAALEQAFVAQKDLNDGFKLQYTIKLDVNGNVSGYGIYGSETNSEFIVNADRFAVTTPSSSIPLRANSTAYAAGAIARVDGVNDRTLVCKTAGTTGVSVPTVTAIGTRITDGTVVWQVASRVPFAVQATPASIGGVGVPAGVYVDAAYILNATINNAQIADAAIDDAKIANLSVNKLTAGSLQTDSYVQSSNYIAGTQGFRISANGTAEFQNAVVRGTVFATDGQFVGEVIALGSGGNKARMWAGDFEVYKQVPGAGLVLYKALSRVESGVGANNVSVTIPGYFVAQPRVIVSPANMTLYNKDYANQNQSIQCEARDLVETSAGSMSWRFTPLATLNLAANTGQTVVNASSGSISTGWTSSQYTTPANTASITPNITLTSLRGTGTSGGYYLRTVRWKVEYLSGGVWVSSSWTTSALGANAPATITTNTTFSFPSAGTWTFRIVTEAYDSGGTFSTGTQYETATDNISRTGDVQVTSTTSSPVILNYTPTYSVPSGWTVTGVTYNFVYSYFLGSSNFGSASVSGSGIFHSIGSNTSASGNFISRSYSRSDNLLSFTATGYSISVSYATARLTLHSATGVVTRQRPLTNSTTASNSFSFNYYDYSLSAAQVLATGTLNWIAIGE